MKEVKDIVEKLEKKELSLELKYRRDCILGQHNELNGIERLAKLNIIKDLLKWIKSDG